MPDTETTTQVCMTAGCGAPLRRRIGNALDPHVDLAAAIRSAAAWCITQGVMRGHRRTGRIRVRIVRAPHPDLPAHVYSAVEVQVDLTCQMRATS